MFDVLASHQKRAPRDPDPGESQAVALVRHGLAEQDPDASYGADPIAPVMVELAIAFGDYDRPPMER